MKTPERRAPDLSAAQRRLLGGLDTLEALASYLISQDERRRELLWETADLLAAWISTHANGGHVTPLYRSLAQATGWSSRFVRDLVRTAAAFPPDARARHADKSWQWFAECLRDGDPQEAAERYADMSVREIRDYRRSRKQRPGEPGYIRLSVTLRPDHVQELEATDKVAVTTVLPSGHEARVTIRRGAPAVREPGDRELEDAGRC